MLVFVAALERELVPILPLLQLERREQVKEWAVRWGTAGGTPVALVCCGMGRERAQAGARSALHTCRAQGVIALGFAGAASPRLAAGDVVLPEEVVADEEGLGPIRPDEELLSRASSALESTPLQFHQGRLLTAAKALGAQEKRSAGEGRHVSAVDMETYWIAREAREAGVPFLAVRAISDEMLDPVPDYRRLVDSTGRMRAASASWYLVTHPHMLRTLASLGRKAGRASASLGVFATSFLTTSPVPARGARG